MAKKLSRMEEQQVQDHAEMTKTLYEEISTTMRQKLKDEERSKMARQRERLEADCRRELQVKESEFAQALAAERKEASKVNLKNVTLEEQVRNLEREKEQLFQEKETLIKQQADYDLQPVRGIDGKCKRCEALIIASG
jgi:hypothetical protein